MSRAFKKPERPSRKLTDYFPRRSSVTTSPSSSQAPQSSPVQAPLSQHPIQSQRKVSRKNSVPLKLDSDAISISSESPITISPNSRSPITISSDSHSVIVISSDVSPAKQVKTESSADDVQIISPPKKAMVPRSSIRTSAKTSVRRVAPPVGSDKKLRQKLLNDRAKPKSSSLKRKFGVESDSELSTAGVMYIPRCKNIPTILPAFSSSPPSSPLPSFPPLVPLAPRGNIPSTPTKSRRSPKSTPSKRARHHIPVHPESSTGHEADVEELVPSSQSDEQELAGPKDIRKDPDEVRRSVDTWRKEASAVLPSESAEPMPPIEDLNPPDLVMNMDIDVDVDVHPNVTEFATLDSSEVSSVQQTSGPLTPNSEVEVSLHLAQKSSQTSPSPLVGSTFLTTPTAKHSLVDTSHPPEPAEPIFRSHTPPPTEELPPLPRTPVALDAKAKAAQIVAEIKARAAAEVAASSSPMEQITELPDISESDSDGLDDSVFFNHRQKGKGKAMETVCSSTRESSPLTQLESSRASSPIPVPKYNFRRRSPREKRYSAGPSRLLNWKDQRIVTKDRRPSKKQSNPLDSLLKEKRLAHKRGNGSDELQAAEAVVASMSKDMMKEEMHEEEDDSQWCDEDAAMQIVNQRVGGSDAGPSGSRSHHHNIDSDDEQGDDDDLGDMEYEKILGEKGGKAVGKILASDRKGRDSKTKAKAENATQGVLLWIAEGTIEDIMEADSFPALPCSSAECENAPLLSLLYEAVTSGDAAQVSILMDPDILMSFGSSGCAAMLPWLLDLALFSSHQSLSYDAYNTLCCMPDFFQPNSTHFELPFVLISSCLARLGARLDVLEPFGWSIKQHIHEMSLSSEQRSRILTHLISIITAFSRGCRLSPADLPDTTLALLLISLEPSTSPYLRREIRNAIEWIGYSITGGAEPAETQESRICSRVLTYAVTLNPVNRAHLLSCFVRSCPPTGRMARWIARGFLLGLDHSSMSVYRPTPSLEPYIHLLSPLTGSEAMFDIPGNTDKEDYYENLAYHIEILGTALTDIEGYVIEERRMGANEAGTSSTNRHQEKPPTQLETIHVLLDKLHGKIVDTRAAHLDRSRVKAALQQLSFRIHYQFQASLKHIGSGRPRNLRGYFPGASP